MSMDDDPAGADLVAVDEQSWRDELERHSSMRHAIRPSLAEAPTPLESLGIHLRLHQLRARAKIPRLITPMVDDIARAEYGATPSRTISVVVRDVYDVVVYRSDIVGRQNRT